MATVGAPRAALVSSAGDLLDWFSIRYRSKRSSIFLDGLVGGMFLAALLDTDHRVYKLGLYDKCDSKELIGVLFYIGMAHFRSLVLVELAAYSQEAAGADGVETSPCQVRRVWLDSTYFLAPGHGRSRHSLMAITQELFNL